MFVEYLCNRSSKLRAKSFKNYNLVLAGTARCFTLLNNCANVQMCLILFRWRESRFVMQAKTYIFDKDEIHLLCEQKFTFSIKTMTLHLAQPNAAAISTICK